REVFSCHPPKIEPMVRSIMADFKAGKRDCIDIWSSRDDQPVLIKYMAVRDKDNNFVVTLECVQPMAFAQKHFEK
ncbi:MAG: PAS domain-containing protein, partial [Butyrivibrio sp.]|nr:PAS domain-containing protein [Butyrivibrio sp.]